MRPEARPAWRRARRHGVAQESSGGHGDRKARGPCPGMRQGPERTEKPMRILSSEWPRTTHPQDTMPRRPAEPPGLSGEVTTVSETQNEHCQPSNGTVMGRPYAHSVLNKR